MLRCFSVMVALLAISCASASGQSPAPGSSQTIPIHFSDAQTASGTLTGFQDTRGPAASSFNNATGQPEKRLTQKIDLSETIQAFAKIKKLSITQARLETFMFLGLGPQTTGVIPSDTKFKKVATDVFEITASEGYFKRLPGMRRCLELGKKRVIVHVQTLAISPDEFEVVAKLFTPGTMKVHYDRIPAVLPVATGDTLTGQEFEPFVATSTVTRQSIPVTTGNLTNENVAQLHRLITASKTASVLSNPTLSALPGQAATISTMSYQPFVVGTQATKQTNEQVLNSPTVQTIEQGALVRVKATPAAGQIQLLTDVAISQIVAVDEFTSRSSNPPTTVQVPSQRIRQVHLASLVEPGTTVLIDPNFTEPTANHPKASRKTSERKFLVTLRAQIVDMDEDSDAISIAVR